MNPIRRILRSAALFLCVAGTAMPARAADDLTATLDGIIQKNHIPGLVWAMVTPEGGIQTGAAGLRDEENKLPFGADSRFLIGSVTKSVVSTGILKLVTDGKLDLDAPARNYIQGLDFDNPWRETSPVTVRTLLDHTSGLNGTFMWQYFTRNVTPDTPLTEVFTRRGTPLKVRFRPGSSFSYSNQGYVLLALIIERITGERYEDYLEREILAPIGMTDSSFHFRTQAEGRYHDPRLAYSYGAKGRETTKPILLRPAGQFSTTTADMAKFLTFLMGDGSAGGKQLIAPGLVAARGRPTTTLAAKAGLLSGYGLGLETHEINGSTAFCHDGAIESFRARLCIFPTDKKGFFMVFNGDPSYAAFKGASDALAEAVGPTTKAVAPEPHPMAADMKAWEGLYTQSHALYQTMALADLIPSTETVHVEKDRVIITSHAAPAGILHPTGSHVLSSESQTGNSHAFFRDDEGNYLLSHNGWDFRKVSPLYVYGHLASLILAVAGLLWTLGAILVRAVRGFRTLPEHPLFTPFLGLMALGVMIPVVMAQPIEAIGDVTAVNILLAAVTLALPLTLVYALVRVARTPARGKLMTAHGLMALMVLQLCIVLAFWGLMPFVSWTL